MIDATILRGRPRDLTCLGRSCTGHGPLGEPRPLHALRDAEPAPMPPASPPARGRAPRGQLTPRPCNLMASLISV
jgi:hypothetical protein